VTASQNIWLPAFYPTNQLMKPTVSKQQIYKPTTKEQANEQKKKETIEQTE